MATMGSVPHEEAGDHIMAAEDPAPTYLLVTDLVARARNGDELAWNALVELYAPLIWSVCRRYQLTRADREDTAHGGQVVDHGPRPPPCIGSKPPSRVIVAV
jgi:hypothetical protein